MDAKQIFSGAASAFITAAVLLTVFEPGNVTAGDDAPDIEAPSIVIDGCRVSLRAVDYKGGAEPEIELATKSETDFSGKVHLTLRMLAENPGAAMSRVATAPELIWEQKASVSCSPVMQKVNFRAEAKLKEASSFYLSMAPSRQDVKKSFAQGQVAGRRYFVKASNEKGDKAGA